MKQIAITMVLTLGLILLACGVTPGPKTVEVKDSVEYVRIDIKDDVFDRTLKKVHVDKEHMTCYFYDRSVTCIPDPVRMP